MTLWSLSKMLHTMYCVLCRKLRATQYALRLNRLVYVLIILSLSASLLPLSIAIAQDDLSVEFHQLLNQVRLDAGLAPVGKSTLLQQAAQRHADDIAVRGTASHEGSDGSSFQQRIREAGYRAWNDGLLVNEAVWIGLGSSVDALNWFNNNPDVWAIFTDTRYREIGVGYAKDNQGVRYFVITFGSRPGVLPVFVNDGAGVTESPQVAVRLTNEEAEPLGEGTWIGKAIEVRLSNSPTFDNIPWQPWEPLLPWLLESPEPGDYAVYVEFRDGADRTTIAEATIRLVASGEAPPTPTPHAGIVPGPELTPTPSVADGTPDITIDLTTPTGEALPPTPKPLPTTRTAPQTPPPTWTPLPIEEIASIEKKSMDWPVLLAFALQGLALILGFAAFLRRKWV